MINRLVTSGCSFTQGYGKNGNKPTCSWAYHLSKKLNLELINVAKGGKGNEWISNSIIEELESTGYQNTIVVVAWSEVTRLMGSFNEEIVTIRPQDFDGLEGKEEWSSYSDYHKYVIKNQKALGKFFDDIVYCVYKTYHAIHKLKTYLEYKEVPYLFFDAINPSKVIHHSYIREAFALQSSHKEAQDIELSTRTEEHQRVITQEWSDYLFDDKWIDLGGAKTIIELMERNPKLYEGLDGHPNEELSKVIGGMVSEKLVEEKIFFT